MNFTQSNLTEILNKILPFAGQRVYIDRISIEELLYIRKFAMDEPIEKMTCRPILKKDNKDIVKTYEELLKSNNSYLFGVYKKDTDVLIGKESYFDYNSRNKNAEIGYFTLPEFRGQGFTKESLKLMIYILFNHLSMNKITAQTGEFNTESVELLKSLNFKLDGKLRQHHELDGHLYDDYIFSMLKAEYFTKL
jgi:RimJ/RimL family protein N-acetyltransferase